MIPRTDPRGQTLHDFAIGMAIFLLVLGYVFAFIPSLFAPFEPEADSTTVRADRTVDHLTRDVLVETTSVPGLLNVTCTEAFFNTSIDACGFGSTDLQTLAALPSRTDLNVTMWRNDTLESYNGTQLARGPTPDATGPRIVRSVRIVSFDGRDYRFIVRIW